jgi:hypothetical protein
MAPFIQNFRFFPFLGERVDAAKLLSGGWYKVKVKTNERTTK